MKKGKIITLVSTVLLIGALFSTLLLQEEMSNRIIQIVTVVTAVIGAVALYFQFKRDKEINEATFILEFWKSFSENEKLQDIMLKCDKNLHEDKNFFTPEDYPDIVTYAQWLEAFCSIVNRKVLSFYAIDDMYDYMFFVFVNNKYVQEIELLPNKEFYQATFKTYIDWVKYLKKNNKRVLLEENSLQQAFEKQNCGCSSDK